MCKQMPLRVQMYYQHEKVCDTYERRESIWNIFRQVMYHSNDGLITV